MATRGSETASADQAPAGAALLTFVALFPLAATAAPLPVDATAIQAAIDRASPGDVLELGPGRVVGELRLDKPITLRGAGRGRTIIASRGRRPALMLGPGEGTVVLSGMTFTTLADASAHRGAGVMLSGPGRIVIEDVTFRRTTVGRCLTAAISLADEPTVLMRRVRISDHHCFMAGALVVEAGANVEMVDCLVEDNVGELAGAILVAAGGRLRLQDSMLRANRFARGEDGHHLILARGASELQLESTQITMPAETSIAIEAGPSPEVSLVGMAWPESELPDALGGTIPPGDVDASR